MVFLWVNVISTRVWDLNLILHANVVITINVSYFTFVAVEEQKGRNLLI